MDTRRIWRFPASETEGPAGVLDLDSEARPSRLGATLRLPNGGRQFPMKVQKLVARTLMDTDWRRLTLTGTALACVAGFQR